jgi:hypothetical protein
VYTGKDDCSRVAKFTRLVQSSHKNGKAAVLEKMTRKAMKHVQVNSGQHKLVAIR